MAKNYQPVVFKNSRGETISNDPIYLAQQTLANAGIGFDQSQPEVAQANLAAQAAGAQGSDDDEDFETEAPEAEVDEDGHRTYKELKGSQLKSLAEERGVDISGLKKVGQVREALIKADQAEAEGNDEE